MKYLLFQTFCKFQLLQQFLLLVAEAIVLLSTCALNESNTKITYLIQMWLLIITVNIVCNYSIVWAISLFVVALLQKELWILGQKIIYKLHRISNTLLLPSWLIH